MNKIPVSAILHARNDLMSPDLCSALTALQSGAITQHPGDRFIGLALAYKATPSLPLIGARGHEMNALFPVFAFADLDDEGGHEPEMLAAGSLRSIATPEGLKTYGRAATELSLDQVLLETLHELAGMMHAQLIPIIQDLEIDTSLFHDIIAVVVPNGALLFPQYLGEIIRAAVYSQGEFVVPSGLLRVVLDDGASAHGQIAARRDLDALFQSVARLDLFDGLLLPTGLKDAD